MVAIFCNWVFCRVQLKLPVRRSPTSRPFRSVILIAPSSLTGMKDLTGFLINGMSTAGSRLGQASLNLSIAAVDQFKIHEGFFLPSEGPNDAGVVSVATKSGNNHFHGEVFEFVRNTAFDTRQYFDLPGAKPSRFHRNQFGGAVGGPILRNRLFFFGHYEGRCQVLSNTVKATIPSLKMFGGDFSELSTTIYDPSPTIQVPESDSPCRQHYSAGKYQWHGEEAARLLCICPCL